MPAATAHLTATGVAASIGGRVIVEGVDLDVPPGTACAIVGTNGAGKSTLLRALTGITAPTAGIVRINGAHLHQLAPRDRAKLIAFVGQEEAPPAELLLGEMVSLGRVPRRPPWAVGGATERTIVCEALDAVGLADRIDDPCDRLSGGERRRAMLARGLAQGSPLLVLDEPTNHLDVAWQPRILDLARDHAGSLLAAVHDLDLTLRHFDHVAVLHDGRIWAQGPPAEVLTPLVMAQTFAVETAQVEHPTRRQRHLLINPRKEP